MHMCTFDFDHVKVILVSFGGLFPKLGHNSKPSKADESVGSGGKCSMHMGPFDLEHAKVILGYFDPLFTNWMVTPKWVIVIVHQMWCVYI